MSWDNTNRGAIFKNDKKTDNQPDYRGKINVNGVDKEISLWVKESEKAGKFFSVQISEPYVKPIEQVVKEQGDDLPF